MQYHMRHEIPYARAGQTIGLLGGSFDPAHEGHVHITREALKRLGLDQVWWLVSPRNPLKTRGPAVLGRRLAAAKKLMQHPRVKISDFETLMGTRYTADTLQALQKSYPGVRFVWLMGADNMAGLHRWGNWRAIMEQVPVAVIARPGERTGARASKAAAIYAGARLKGRRSALLAQSDAPAWCFLNIPMSDSSSTRIRARGDW
jgi:nicotinate-nucleotide adenylyltransferase